MTHQNHLLYVAWGYPPSRGAGMYRALATANAFARGGWKVTVLTATRDTFERLTGSDPQSEEFIDPRIEVVRIPFAPERDETDLSRWSRARVYSPRLWSYLEWKLSARHFPEPGYGAWKPALIAAAERIHNATPVDLTIGTANPNVDFAPAFHLWKTHKVPFVIDHRDAWHLDVYTGRHLGVPLGRSRRLERKLMDNALEAWFVNLPIRDWHASTYPRNADHFHVVANGFDPAFLASEGPEDAPPPPTREQGLTFGYLGTLYGPVPLRETLEGWRRARAASDLIARSRFVLYGRLGHYAQPDVDIASLLDEYEADGVSYLGSISKTRVTEVYRTFDALAFIASHSKYVTSGKVFEYAATGLPIGAFHHPDTAATAILKGYPRVFPVAHPSPDAIAQAFIDMGEHTVSSGAEATKEARAWAEHLSRDAQLLPRVDTLTSRVRAMTRPM